MLTSLMDIKLRKAMFAPSTLDVLNPGQIPIPIRKVAGINGKAISNPRDKHVSWAGLDCHHRSLPPHRAKSASDISPANPAKRVEIRHRTWW
jgi:hypothetical protein